MNAVNLNYLLGFCFLQVMKVAKCPTDELSLTNCAVVSEQDFDISRIRFLSVL